MKKYIPITLVWTCFALPVGVIVLYAFASSWQANAVLPSGVSLRGLQYLARHAPEILRTLASSTLYSLATVALTFVMCLYPAEVFAFATFPGKRYVEGLLLAPALLPAMGFSMGLHIVFIRLGLADNAAGIILVLSVVSYPYMLRALAAGFQARGNRHEQTAANLGAPPLMILRTITLPLLAPAFVTGASVVFLVSFSEYFLVFLIGGGAVPSFAGMLVPFLQGSDRQIASMLTVVFMIVPVVLFVVSDRIVRARYRRMGL